MGLFDSMKRGYALTIASLRIVCRESWMIILPILTGILLLAILLGFIMLPGSVDDRLSDPITYLFIIAYFFFTYFCFYFVQAMIIEAAAQLFSGKKSSISQAFSGAFSVVGKIFFLSIIGAIVGLISAVLSKDNNGGNIAGKVAGGIIGFGWTLASYFSLPIILHEKTGVFDSFKRSWEILNKSWGEVAGGNASMLLFFVPGFVFLLLGGVISNLWLLGFGFICLLLAMVIMNPVNAVLSQALYSYATTSKVPTGFEADNLKSFFRAK